MAALGALHVAQVETRRIVAARADLDAVLTPSVALPPRPGRLVLRRRPRDRLRAPGRLHPVDGDRQHDRRAGDRAAARLAGGGRHDAAGGRDAAGPARRGGAARRARRGAGGRAAVVGAPSAGVVRRIRRPAGSTTRRSSGFPLRFAPVRPIETILIYGVIPLVVLLLLFAATMLRPSGRKAARYRVGDDWPYEPLWWIGNPKGTGLPGADRRRRRHHRDPDRPRRRTWHLVRPTGELARRQAGPGETPAITGRGSRRGAGRRALAHPRPPPAASPRPPRSTPRTRRSPSRSSQLSRIDEALTRTSAETGLLFTLWVGRARRPHPRARRGAARHARGRRRPTRSSSRCRRASGWSRSSPARSRCAASTTRAPRSRSARWSPRFTEGDLVGGIVEGLRVLGDHAGSKH